MSFIDGGCCFRQSATNIKCQSRLTIHIDRIQPAIRGPDVESSAIRQWFSFPPAVGAIRTSRLRSFQLLVETSRCQVLFVTLRSKAAPDQSTATRIVDLLGDRDPYLDLPVTDGLLDELSLHARMLNCPFDSEDTWLTAPVLAEAVLDESLSRIRLGERFSEADRPFFEGQLRKELRTRISGFIHNLDGVVVEGARTAQSGQCKPSSYNYLRSTDAIDGIRRRNRIQAISIMPFLLPVLPTLSWLEPVRQAIDRGKPPLIDVLSGVFGVPKAVIRSLRNQPASSIGPDWEHQPEILIKLLTDIPDGVRPRTREMWESFNSTVALIAKISGRPVDATANRLWLRAAALQGYRVADVAEIANVELERAAHDIDEFSRRLADVLNYQLRTTPDFSNSIAAAAAVRALVTTHNPVRLARFARRWREAYTREQAQFAEERQLWLGARWEAVISEPYETETRRIVCLTTADELVAEGKMMHNCVASYAGACLQGRSQIWSIQDLTGKQMSTLETCIHEDTLLVRIVQHAGPKNVTPSATCNRAAALLLKYLEQRASKMAAYSDWRKSIAARPTNERTLIALYRPIIAAFDATLPKRWPLDRLRTFAKAELVRLSTSAPRD